MADSNLFTVKLVTPERILLDGPASEVILRTGEGDITILDGHTPVVGSVEPGVVRVVREDGQVERVAVHGGFIQVEQHAHAESGGDPSGPAIGGTRVTLLIGVAELAEEIDSERARVALEAAEARLAELASSGRGTGASDDDEPDAELAEAEASRLRAQVRLETVETTSASAA
jgi:F-type H+-transporting ATPase subunit epsilon